MASGSTGLATRGYVSGSVGLTTRGYEPSTRGRIFTVDLAETITVSESLRIGLPPFSFLIGALVELPEGS